MKGTLLDIQGDILALESLLAECEGDAGSEEAAEWVAQWFAELDGNLSHKVDNYAALISELEARAEVRQAEADRMASRAKADRNKAGWLRDRLKAVLMNLRQSKVEGQRYTVSVQQNGGVQPMEITGDVPPNFRFMKSEVDKAAIRTALLEGSELSFARLLPRGESLRIR